MYNKNVPFSWCLSKIAYDSSKILKGVIFGYLVMYSVGATYLIMKGAKKNVRSC